MGERVFESVLQVREETGLIQELRGLQAAERSAQIFLGWLRNRLEQRNRDVLPHHRRHLQHRLVPERQPVDAGGQRGLHGGRDVDGRQGPRHPVASALAEQGLGLGEGPHALFQEEGVPSVRAIKTRLSGSRVPSSPSRALSNSSALSAGSGSIRSCA
jgi:hypothetical protein